MISFNFYDSPNIQVSWLWVWQCSYFAVSLLMLLWLLLLLLDILYVLSFPAHITCHSASTRTDAHWVCVCAPFSLFIFIDISIAIAISVYWFPLLAFSYYYLNATFEKVRINGDEMNPIACEWTENSFEKKFSRIEKSVCACVYVVSTKNREKWGKMHTEMSKH